MIRNNTHLYSVSAIISSSSNRRAHMCAVLEIKRSTYYYHINLDATSLRKTEDIALSKEIERTFKESRNNYGARKIKRELLKLTEPK